MSERDAAAARHLQVLAIVSKYLDAKTLEIVKSALVSDERMAIIRDMFLEGRDHEGVHAIRELGSTGRLCLLPCGSERPIQPGQSALIATHPQVRQYTPQYLLVSRTCANHFLINEIRIGNCSQLAQSGDVPADVFAVDAPALEGIFEKNEGWITVKIDRSGSSLLGIRLDLATADLGQEIVLIVTNVSELPRAWRASWLGEARSISYATAEPEELEVQS